MEPATGTSPTQYDNPQASEWRIYTDNKKEDRDHSVIFAGLSLGTAACFGAAAASNRRREQEESLSDTSEE